MTAAQITGRDVTSVVVDQDEWVAAQVAAGRQEFVTCFLLGMYLAAQQGYFAGVDSLLGTLLGRDRAPCATCSDNPPTARRTASGKRRDRALASDTDRASHHSNVSGRAVFIGRRRMTAALFCGLAEGWCSSLGGC